MAGATVAFGRLAGQVSQSPGTGTGRRHLLVLLCIVSVFAPGLLAAYAYAQWLLKLVHQPSIRELVYVGILVLRIAPAGALLHVLFPPRLGASGRHCLRLAPCATGRVRWKLRLRGVADTSGIVFTVAFLLAFHEFELASLTGIDAWTVRLFDAHAGGLPWSGAMRLAAAPFLVQCALVAGLVILLQRRCADSASMVPVMRQCPGWQSGIVWSAAVLAVAAGAVVPAVLVGREAISGARQLVDTFALHREIVASLLFGLGGGMLAFAAGALKPAAPLWSLVAVGLSGPLLLGLGAVRVFQFGMLRDFYDSPLPLTIVLALLLLPVAVLLATLRRGTSSRAGAHVARLSGSLLPRWHISGQRILASVVLLCLLAYAELTASAILAPPGMTPAPVRLYNLMHYGQNAVLSAMALVTFLAPLGIAGTVWALLMLGTRIYRRRR